MGRGPGRGTCLIIAVIVLTIIVAVGITYIINIVPI
jgi:hypothetical protein